MALVYLMCRLEVGLYSAPEDDCCQQSLGNRFLVFVDYEDAEDPGTLKSIHIRNWLLSERVLSAMTEALTLCSHLTSLK